MSISYEETGRTRQKARTRGALVAAARELLTAGAPATVEGAADTAGISRATAYRYFPNQRALLVATYPDIGEGSLLGDPAPDDPLERLDVVAARLVAQVVEHEPELRAMLRLSLEPGDRPDLPFRTGRRIGWIADALEPLRGTLPRRRFDSLVNAIAAGLGIEALVWMTDIAGLGREEAGETMRWSARSLLRAALSE